MDSFTNQQIEDTLKIIESSVVNCKKVQPKLKAGSASFTLSQNRIKALSISKSLLLNQTHTYSQAELETAVVQITSIKNKSITGLRNAKQGSSTYTRFSRLIAAMEIILAYLNQVMESNVINSELSPKNFK